MSTRAVAAAAARAIPSRVASALALVPALAAAILIVVAQPVGGPWWTYAEADAVYVANGLNLLGGVQVRYLDHPGLPLEELAAVAFGIDFAFETVTGDVATRGEYVDDRMLDLDQTRPIFRGLAIMIYLGGTIAFFVLFARLFGHWAWGLATSLLWLSAPGLIPTSIQYKADVSLAVLIGVFAYLIARAAAARSAALYAWASVVAGFAVMVKLHALGLLVPLVLAALWRPPAPGWWGEVVARARRWVRRGPIAGRLFALAAALAVLAAGLVLNVGLIPFAVAPNEAAALVPPVVAVALLLAAGWVAQRPRFRGTVGRVFGPFVGFVAAAYVVGLSLPAILDLPDWIRALYLVEQAARGRGVNTGVEPFGLDVFSAENAELQRAAVVFVLAAAAAAVGLVRRDPLPVLWFSGAAVLVAMAFARQAYVHYFAPGFVLAIPAAVWLVSRAPRRARYTLAVALVGLLVVPAFDERGWSTQAIERQVTAVSPSIDAIRERLGPGEVALTSYYWPEPDNRWFNDVQFYVNYAPEYPYRFLPASVFAAQIAGERELRFRYYTGPEVADFDGTETLELGDVGTFRLRRLGGYDYAAELLSGPGVESPWTPPDAP